MRLWRNGRHSSQRALFVTLLRCTRKCNLLAAVPHPFKPINVFVGTLKKLALKSGCENLSFILIFILCGYGGTADALVSGTSESNLLQVQILLTAPQSPNDIKLVWLFLTNTSKNGKSVINLKITILKLTKFDKLAQC